MREMRKGRGGLYASSFVAYSGVFCIFRIILGFILYFCISGADVGSWLGCTYHTAVSEDLGVKSEDGMERSDSK